MIASFIYLILALLLLFVYGENNVIKYPMFDKNYSPSILELWRSHSHPFRLHKYSEYADNYMRHLPYPTNDLKDGATIRLLEIGVQSGGSLIEWKRYYGKNSVIVGLDIDARCKRSHSPEENIFVEIGSQMNSSLLLEVCEKYGPFHVIIDDGGELSHLILVFVCVTLAVYRSY
jgi:hypothetical protein